MKAAEKAVRIVSNWDKFWTGAVIDGPEGHKRIINDLKARLKKYLVLKTKKKHGKA